MKKLWWVASLFLLNIEVVSWIALDIIVICVVIWFLKKVIREVK